MHPLKIGFAALAAALLPVFALAQTRGEQFYGPHMWGGGWHGGMFMGFVMMILFVVVIVVLVVLAVRWVGGGSRSVAAGRTPQDILRERFARGEIDADEFAERRKLLDD